MLKRILTIGLSIGFVGILFWLVLIFPIPKIFIILLDILAVALWIYFNYTTFSSKKNYSIPSKFVQIYGIPLLILAIGLLGDFFHITIFSVLFSIYFMPFVDVLVMVLNPILGITNHLAAPFVMMFIISLLTLVVYRIKTTVIVRD